MTGGGLFRIKPPTIITDAQFHGGPRVDQVDLHLAGGSMLGHIIERLLADPVDRHLHIGREDALSHHGDLCRNIRPPGERIPQKSQQIAELGIGQGRRAQFREQSAHFRHGAAGQFAQVLE